MLTQISIPGPVCRRRLDDELASFAVLVFGPRGPGDPVEQCDPGQPLAAVVPVLASELEERQKAWEQLGVERDRLSEQVEQLQAEVTRLRAERAEADCRHDAVVRRDGGLADYHPSERFRAAVISSVPSDGGPPTRSEWLPQLRSLTASPVAVPGDDPPERTFPREADLALVRAQVEVLNQLLSSGPSTGHVLIYQKRLTEFTLKIREASRLASSLASEVERTRQRDEMQYHMYLVRRAGEIDQNV
jgi:hypothetical protein